MNAKDLTIVDVMLAGGSRFPGSEKEMNMPWIKKLTCALLVLAVPSGAIRAQSGEETVESASEVLREIMAIPAKGIPASLLAESKGVVIIPGMVKGGFVVGIRHGKGVILARNAAGEWTTPVFITVTGGSVGLQAGLQATDVVAVFRNRQGVERLMHDKFTIGADAAVAAGPIGREASAATDAQMKAEILSYSRSRGLFAGVAIDGACVHVDHRANAAYYAPKLGQPKGAVPVSAIKLVEQIAAYADPRNKVAINVREAPMIPPPPQADDIEALRAHLAASSLHLHKILEPQWKEYLALPAEVYAEGKTPAKEVISRCLDRYGAVANEPRYRDLAARPEFRETHALLLRYRSAVEGQRSATLALPPPPN
jgi:SH3 domain-containing YSC84-like protein 1